MHPLPRRPTIAERFAAIDALLNQFDAALAEAARASAAIRAILAGDAAPCAGCGHPRASHWEDSEPDGPRTGCSRLGCPCTAYDGDDGEPLFDGPVTTKAELDEAYDAAELTENGPCMWKDCDHPESRHDASRPGKPCEDCDPASGCRRYLSPRPGGLTDDEWRARLRIAPGGSAGPASLASVQVQADGSVTAEHPTSFIALPAPTLAGGQS